MIIPVDLNKIKNVKLVKTIIAVVLMERIEQGLIKKRIKNLKSENWLKLLKKNQTNAYKSETFCKNTVYCI